MHSAIQAITKQVLHMAHCASADYFHYRAVISTLRGRGRIRDAIPRGFDLLISTGLNKLEEVLIRADTRVGAQSGNK